MPREPRAECLRNKARSDGQSSLLERSMQPVIRVSRNRGRSVKLLSFSALTPASLALLLAAAGSCDAQPAQQGAQETTPLRQVDVSTQQPRRPARRAQPARSTAPV